jgi:predicted Fe-S protein YdhL (DUF1289 family)
VFINCTLKRSPERSHTQGLIDLPAEILARQNVSVEEIRAVDNDLATGVWPDMTEHGRKCDTWPASGMSAVVDCIAYCSLGGAPICQGCAVRKRGTGRDPQVMWESLSAARKELVAELVRD